jgi:hypothetical protein
MKKFSVVLALCILAGTIAVADEESSVEESSCAKKELGAGKKCGKEQCQTNHREMMIERLKMSDPAKFEELKKLRTENPEEFKAKIKELAKEAMEKIKKEREEMNALADKYRETKSEEDKAALKTRIEEQMKSQLQNRKEHIANMEAKILKAKEEMATQEKDFDSMVETKLNAIIEGKTQQMNHEGKGKGKKENE